MRKLLPVLLLHLALCASGQGTINLVLELVKPVSEKLDLKVVLADNAHSFEYEEQAVVVKVSAQYPITRVTLPNVAPGSYGIKVYVDMNSNGKLDYGWNNVPTEPFGFSNNPTKITGSPTVDQAFFTVVDGVNVVRITVH
jgi:uncharacterized protein (DUF2141 family)